MKTVGHLTVLIDVLLNLVVWQQLFNYLIGKVLFSLAVFLALGLNTKILSSVVRVDRSKVPLHRSNLVLLSPTFLSKLHSADAK